MITILGKERKLNFNIYGIEQMQKKARSGSEISNAYAMIWGGLEGQRYRDDVDADYTFGDIIDAIDAMDSKARKEVIAEAEKLLTESQAYKSLVPDKPKQEKKRTSQNSTTKT